MTKEDTLDKGDYEYINSISLSDNKDEEPIMILLHINKNHYQLIYFIEDLEEGIKSMETNKEKINSKIKIADNNNTNFN